MPTLARSSPNRRPRGAGAPAGGRGPAALHHLRAVGGDLIVTGTASLADAEALALLAHLLAQGFTGDAIIEDNADSP